MRVNAWLGTLGVVMVIAGCPAKEEAAPPEPPAADEAAPPADEAAPPADEAAPAPEPPVPTGVGHLENDSWVDAAPPSEVPDVAKELGMTAYGKLAGAQEKARAEACKADPSKVVVLDSAASRVGFMSYKNKTLPVPGKIDDVHGFAVLGPSPKIAFWANLLTVNTGDPGRDARLSKLFFENETGANAALRFSSTKVTGLPESGLPADEGSKVAVSVEGELLMHGRSVPVTLPLELTRKGEGWEGRLASETLLQFDPFGFLPPLQALMKACNHESMGTAVALVFELRVVPGCKAG